MSRLDTAQGFPTGNLEAYVTELGENKLKLTFSCGLFSKIACIFVSECTYSIRVILRTNPLFATKKRSKMWVAQISQIKCSANLRLKSCHTVAITVYIYKKCWRLFQKVTVQGLDQSKSGSSLAYRIRGSGYALKISRSEQLVLFVTVLAGWLGIHVLLENFCQFWWLV